MLWMSGCGNAEDSGKIKTADSAKKQTTSAGETKAGENEQEKKMENSDDNSAAWEDVGGVKVRKNKTVQGQLEGFSYVQFESYNSGGGSGGYSSESRMTFCPGGKMSMYSQSVTTINVEGAGGNSASEESDEGTFEIYEDQKGNYFLKIKLKKSGEGFIHIKLDGGKMTFEDGRSFSRKQGGC
ncbi:MAG: hypothetical protein FD123_2480 [Bacteroidetes bacterium]|nr:MAG: hypothetical protein FD123_2480 [Bacteroidota bacterium]